MDDFAKIFILEAYKNLYETIEKITLELKALNECLEKEFKKNED